MKKIKIILGAAAILAGVSFLISADHIDAPAVVGQYTDITDLYVFEAPNPNNLVFVANVRGLLSPSATAVDGFKEKTLYEFNIDNDGDNVEDFVIQAIVFDNQMHFYGPVEPNLTGLTSEIVANAIHSVVDVSTYSPNGSGVIAENSGMSFFAGPRDDPFFMDFAQFGQILAGNATGFNNPGSDTFAGTNVLSLVVEVPKVMICGDGTSIGVWLEAKYKDFN